MNRKKIAFSVAVSILIGSCAGEAPVNVIEKDSSPSPDTYSPPPLADIGTPPQPKDQYVWPDTTVPVDTWPNPNDSYASTPFGCTIDADCFGRKCCETPWGVKLCADQCGVLPDP